MKMMALIADTFREIYAKKVILGVVGLQVIILIITGLALFGEGVQEDYRRTRMGGAGATDSAVISEQPAQPKMPDSAALDTSLLGSDTPVPADTIARDSAPAARSHAFDTPIADSAKGSNNAAHGDGRRELEEQVRGQLGAFAVGNMVLMVLVGLFIMAGIVPSMMEKGTIDLLLSKPLSRTSLLLGRALGGLLAVALNFAFFLLALWTLYGLASSVWHPAFLLFTFAVPLFLLIVTYSAVMAISIFTESWILPLIFVYLHLAALSPPLYGREALLYTSIESPILRGIIDGLYYILPQSTDLIGETGTGVFTGSIEHIGPFIQGTIFAIVMFGVAVWKFNRKDF